jgi:hypothetical protein
MVERYFSASSVDLRPTERLRVRVGDLRRECRHDNSPRFSDAVPKRIDHALSSSYHRPEGRQGRMDHDDGTPRYSEAFEFLLEESRIEGVD